jgi:hypothetical protein
LYPLGNVPVFTPQKLFAINVYIRENLTFTFILCWKFLVWIVDTLKDSLHASRVVFIAGPSTQTTLGYQTSLFQDHDYDANHIKTCSCRKRSNGSSSDEEKKKMTRSKNYLHVCLVISRKDGRVIAEGFNGTNSGQPSRARGYSKHAEEDALDRLLKLSSTDPELWSKKVIRHGVDVVSLRVTRQLVVGSSAPCARCSNRLFSVRNIVRKATWWCIGEDARATIVRSSTVTHISLSTIDVNLDLIESQAGVCFTTRVQDLPSIALPSSGDAFCQGKRPDGAILVQQQLATNPKKRF